MATCFGEILFFDVSCLKANVELCRPLVQHHITSCHCISVRACVWPVDRIVAMIDIGQFCAKHMLTCNSVHEQYRHCNRRHILLLHVNAAVSANACNIFTRVGVSL